MAGKKRKRTIPILLPQSGKGRSALERNCSLRSGLLALALLPVFDTTSPGKGGGWNRAGARHGSFTPPRFSRSCVQEYFPIASAEIIAEEQRHGVRVAESIELLDEADGSAALLGGMIEPLTATDGDAVVAGKAFVSARGNELFSTAAEELLQVHRRGSFFLLGCKRNVL